LNCNLSPAPLRYLDKVKLLHSITASITLLCFLVLPVLQCCGSCTLLPHTSAGTESCHDEEETPLVKKSCCCSSQPEDAPATPNTPEPKDDDSPSCPLCQTKSQLAAVDTVDPVVPLPALVLFELPFLPTPAPVDSWTGLISVQEFPIPPPDRWTEIPWKEAFLL